MTRTLKTLTSRPKKTAYRVGVPANLPKGVTPSDVRLMYASGGRTQEQIAVQLGVTRQQVWRALRATA